MDINPEPSALDLAVRPEFRQLSLHEVDRDGEADTHVHAGARVDRGIDTHHRTAQVDERTARIAGINRGVGLEKVVVIARDEASLVTLDSTRPGILIAHSVAMPPTPFAPFSPVNIPHHSD